IHYNGTFFRSHQIVLDGEAIFDFMVDDANTKEDRPQIASFQANVIWNKGLCPKQKKQMLPFLPGSLLEVSPIQGWFADKEENK
ncbi:hypothetical protein HAX54_035072, partial [Datura stramonium]|nr:hypothetical protein [Datura stramonium]